MRPFIAKNAGRPRRRGFTLVELLVAMSGGLFLSIIVFVLAKQGSRFYQRETRVSSATLTGLVGFERLRGDIERAGFLTSPNLTKDPSVCANKATLPLELKRMASVRIQQAGSPANAVFSANSLSPDQIIMAGAYTSVDQFPARAITFDGTTYQVFLQRNTGPMARINYETTAAGLQAGLLTSVFPEGRVLRIVDDAGAQHFGVLTDGHEGGDTPFLELNALPPLTFRSGAGTLCGIRGNGTGALVNVVNFVQYDLRNLSTLPANPYAALYSSSAGAPYEDQRTELVRTEIDVAGDEIAGTQELIAEYAVDFKLGITVVNAITGGTDPSVVTLLPGDANISNWAGDASTILVANRGPHFIRGLRVRLSVRSREGDREGNISATPDIAAGLYRVALGDGGAAPFARVRTLQADIALRNQMRQLWP